MRILITGGAGFVGSHLAQWLLEQKHEVQVLDNFSTGKERNIEPIRDSITLIVGDICDMATVQAAMQGVELVFHLAALVSVVESIEDPLRTYAVNSTGSLHVLEAARQAGVRRVVQMSSAAVYGNTSDLPVSEDSPLQPLSPYASTKLVAEQAGHLYTLLYGVETVALRAFNIYGPRQDPASPYASVIPRFVRIIHQGGNPTIYGDGEQTRDFVFVGDVVQALWTAATVNGIAGRVFNVGSGTTTSVRQLAQLVGEAMGVVVSPHFAEARVGEVRHSCANVERFAREANFRVSVPLHTGLQATVAEGL